MGTVPLPNWLKIQGAERFIPAICIAASLLGAGFVFMGGSFGIIPERQVTLETQGFSDNYFTSARTVGDFLEEIDIRISEFDSVVPASGTPVRPGMVITYSRAKRVMIADAGIEPFEVMCSGRTVCDLLTQVGIGIRPLDRVVPPPDAVLENGMEVNITRVEVLDFTVEREIEPELVIEPDPDLPRGHMEEVNPGVPGIAEDITRIFIRNGEETARVDIGSRVVSEPQDRVARVGVRSAPPLASRSGVHRDVMEMDATGYDPGPLSCAPFADGLTATGHIAGFGVCAVDPNVIPLGTEVWVEGYGYALACDTGGAIRGNRIDMCFNTRSEALRWGRRNVLVYILD